MNPVRSRRPFYLLVQNDQRSAVACVTLASIFHSRHLNTGNLSGKELHLRSASNAAMIYWEGRDTYTSITSANGSILGYMNLAQYNAQSTPTGMDSQQVLSKQATRSVTLATIH